MRRIIVLLAVVLLLIIAGVARCAGAQKADVHIGYLLGDIHHLPLFVALEKGFYKAEKVNVKIIGPFDAGTAEMDALAANQLDIGYVGTPPAVIAAARNVDLSIISGVNTGGSALIVDKTIGNVSELRGKKIATPLPGSIQYIMLGMLLNQNNMTYRDLELFAGTIKLPDMPAALERGHINGCIVWEPYAARAVVAGMGKVLVESKDIWTGHPCCVLVTRNDFAEKNPEIVESVVKVHKQAIKFIDENPDEAKTIAAKYTKLEMDIMEEALQRVKFDYTINVEATKKFVKEIILLGETGVIKPIIKPEEVPDIGLFLSKLINSNFLER